MNSCKQLSSSIYKKTTFNKVDSLRTDNEVFTFVRQHNKNYKGYDTFEVYRNETRRIADSLKVQNWVKADIDNNGETDLLVFRADNLADIFAILSTGDTFQLASAQYFCKYQFMYPVVTTLNNRSVILLYNQDQIDYDADIKHFIYTKLTCDTLIVKENLFINYVKSPRHYEIEKIEIDNDGLCEGNCPRINIKINAKTFVNKCSKEMYWDSKPQLTTGQLTKEEIKDILLLLDNSDFVELNEKYAVVCTDQPTTTLTITYNNGKTKTISDYGSSSNFTLTEIYKVAYNIKWTDEKGSR